MEIGSDEHPIIVRPGLITLTDTSDFGNPLKVGGQNRRPTGYTGLNPADAVARWQLVRGEDDCELVDSALGWVRGLPEAFIDDEDPVCSIQVVARKDNYALFKSEPVNNRMLKGDLGTLTAADLWLRQHSIERGGIFGDDHSPDGRRECAHYLSPLKRPGRDRMEAPKRTSARWMQPAE